MENCNIKLCGVIFYVIKFLSAFDCTDLVCCLETEWGSQLRKIHLKKKDKRIYIVPGFSVFVALRSLIFDGCVNLLLIPDLSFCNKLQSLCFFIIVIP